MRFWKTWRLALVLALALCGAQEARAQDDAAGPANPPAFVDENGDGINDNAPKRHRRGLFHRRGAGLTAQLSTEQQAELKALLEGLKASEAAKEDVHAAVEAKLAEWGVERPERPEKKAGPRRLGSVLSEEQRAELTALVAGLKDSEASREDVRAAVEAKLAEWGVERPKVQKRGPRFNRRHHRGGPAPTGDAAPADGAAQ